VQNLSKMETIRFIWQKQDTFLHIREKLISLIGKELIQRQNENLPITIFSVGEIKEDIIYCIGAGFFKFLDGDFEYQDGNGGYNFKGSGEFPVWSYSVTYGRVDKNGCTLSQVYKFSIPRTDNYNKDIEKCTIFFDENHPFVFYETDYQSALANER